MHSIINIKANSLVYINTKGEKEFLTVDQWSGDQEISGEVAHVVREMRYFFSKWGVRNCDFYAIDNFLQVEMENERANF